MNVRTYYLKYNVQVAFISSFSMKDGDGAVQFGFKYQYEAVQLEQFIKSPELGDGAL